MHRWVLVEEPGFGVALVNDSTYGYDVTRDVREDGTTTCVRLSLLRAPRFPDPQTDQGVQTHRYGLVIGADVEAATESGHRLNLPLRRVPGGAEVAPLVTVTGRGLVISSVTLAADRSGDLVVRLYESLGARTTGELVVDAEVVEATEVTLLEEPLTGGAPIADGSRVPLALQAFEVRTLRLRVRRP
jgi:alpha-mannosidase